MGSGENERAGERGSEGVISKSDFLFSRSPVPPLSRSPTLRLSHSPLPSLPLLRFRARFAAERVMRQEPVALQPDDYQVAGRQFHVRGVPLVARDNDGKAV